MRSNYSQLGKYIREVDVRNSELGDVKLLGVSIQKVLMPSIANIIGTDMSTYKLIKKNQLVYGPVTSRNSDRISVALLHEYEKAMVSQAYITFEVIDKNELLPEYLMMWFRRPEFDRYARFMSHGSAREIFSWEEMCNLELPIPSISKQKDILKEYNVLVGKINLGNQLIQKLEETAQAIYKQWFVDFEFPDENGNPYKSHGGEMEFNMSLEREIPKGWVYNNFKAVAGRVFSGGTPDTNVEDYWNGEFSWFSSGETRNTVVIDSERTITKNGVKNSSTRQSKVNDTLIASAGQGKTRGQSSFCKIDTYINQSIICIRPLKQFYSTWIFFNVHSRYAEIRNDSDVHSIRGSITTKDIENLPLVIPTDPIILNFETIGSAIVNKIYTNRKILKELEKLKEILHIRMSFI